MHFQNMFHGLALAKCVIAFILSFTSLSLSSKTCDSLPINDIQVIGSHNSYKKPLLKESKKALEQRNPKRARRLDYSHDSIAKQLDLGLRHLEIDILRDPKGRLFSQPLLEKMANKVFLTAEERAAYMKPGLKVMHIPDVDFGTHCISFKECLLQITRWSDKNPTHLPIYILMNVKENNLNWPGVVKPLTFRQEDYHEVDRQISSIMGDKLITPNHIKQKGLTLEKSVLRHGWPSLNSARGKFIFIFDGNSRQRELYRKDRPSLKGSSMFASYDKGEDEAAIMIINDPVSNFDKISKLVDDGFLVRTRTDASIDDAIEKNYKRRDLALKSGAQIISTDFYPGSPQEKTYDFYVNFSDSKFVRYTPKQRKDRCEILE